MCGACSRDGLRDWLTPAVPTRTARELAARTVTELVVATRLRVRASDSGFAVHHPTGKVVLAPHLTAVWDEVIRTGPIHVDSPVHPDRAEALSVLPLVPATRLVLLIGDSPERTAQAWRPDRVLRIGEESLGDLLSAHQLGRVLAWTPDSASCALAAVTAPEVRLRATLVAALRDGAGPAWTCNLDGHGDQALRAILQGRASGTIDRPDLSGPRAAAWTAGLLATGGTAGRRLTLSVANHTVVIDAADGTGLAVRPAE